MLKNTSSIEVKAEVKSKDNIFEISIDLSAMSASGKKPATMNLFYPNLPEEIKDMIMGELVKFLSSINKDADDFIIESGKKTIVDFIISEVDYTQLLDMELGLIEFLTALNKAGRGVNTGYKAAQ